MPNLEDESDAISNALSSRRIPHSRSHQPGHGGKGKGKKGNGAAFDPLKALGYYEVRLGTSNKSARRAAETDTNQSSWLELHELTEGDDGLVGTFDLADGSGRMSGMCLLAGSRKGLAKIVEDLDRESEDEDEEEEQEKEDENEDDKAEPGSEDDDGHSEDGISHHEVKQNPIEAADAKLNNRYNAFEKNSFRNPKFWLCCKTRLSPSLSSTIAPQLTTGDTDAEHSTTNLTSFPTKTTEKSQGYLVFANNICDKFEGTISCSSLGWDNVKMLGWKVRSKATACPTTWTDLD